MDFSEHVGGEESPPGTPLWTYAYQMRPPHAERRMTVIRALLEQESTGAAREHRKWTARLVSERQVTHLLIVSDNPEMDRDVNRRIEAALRDMDVGYSVTMPLPVV